MRRWIPSPHAELLAHTKLPKTTPWKTGMTGRGRCRAAL